MDDASQIRVFKNAPDLSDPVEQERLSPAGLGAFVSIAKKWSLNDAQALGLLGAVTPSTLRGLPNQNPLFAGNAPVDYMIQHGQLGMATVRRLIDSRNTGQ
jgi:hypothetical protein